MRMRYRGAKKFEYGDEMSKGSKGVMVTTEVGLHFLRMLIYINLGITGSDCQQV